MSRDLGGFSVGEASEGGGVYIALDRGMGISTVITSEQAMALATALLMVAARIDGVPPEAA